jgi:protein O-mannosyl-transferase
MPKTKQFSSQRTPRPLSGISDSSLPPPGALAGAVLIIAIVTIAYLPSLSGGFIWDDKSLITENNIIKASNGLYRLWCSTESADYWPATYTTFWIEWRLWGMNSAGYHVTNLIFHIIETLLIWIVLRRLSIPGAFLAAMIFALHPVNVESVSWIAQRKNTTAMLFFLLSILWYVKFLLPAPLRVAAKQTLPTDHRPLTTSSSFILHPSSFWYCLSLAAFVLAMLGKGSTVVLPVLLLGIIWWLRHLRIRDLWRTAPFFIITIVLGGVNVWFQRHGADEMIRTTSFQERMLGAGSVVWFYLYKALLPIDLSFVYPQWRIDSANPLWWMPLVSVFAVTVVLWLYRKSWSRPFLFAWGFFCVALVPVMGLTDVYFMRYSLVADHYQHIAIIGVIALASAAWSTWYKSLITAANRAVLVIAIAAVGTLAFLTFQQTGLYRDEITLFQDALKKNPNSWLAHNNIGSILLDMDRVREASDHFQQALRGNPDFFETHNNLGNVFLRTGRLPEAIESYKHAIRLNPGFAKAYYNLGLVLIEAGSTGEAIKSFEQALHLDPDLYVVHNRLGNILLDAGRLPEAIDRFQQALASKPDYPEAHNNLGNALLQSGRYKEAVEHYRQTLVLKPDSAVTYYNLAVAYANLQQKSEALASAQKALDLARSQGQTELGRQIEDWLNTYKGQ